MIPVYQTRVGADGNCFAAALASILETKLPEFGEDTLYWWRVRNWLRTKGVRYVRVPLADPPRGWSTIEGGSPRGGLHACVAYNGVLKFDPHPPSRHDGQGLVEPRYYGVLKPLTQDAVTLHSDKDGELALRYTAEDMSGKELKGALAPVYVRHDVIKDDWARNYATHSGEVAGLINETKRLLAASRIGDKQFWIAKLREAENDMSGAKSAALNGDARAATRHQEHALAVAHHVLDALKSLVARTVKDATIQNASQAQLRARLEKINGAQPETAALERLLKMKAKDSVVDPAEVWRRYGRVERASLLRGADLYKLQDLAAHEWNELPARVRRKLEDEMNYDHWAGRGKDSFTEPKCGFCGGSVEEAQNSDKGWCSSCNKLVPIRAQRSTWGPVNAKDAFPTNRRVRLHKALDWVLDAKHGRARDEESAEQVWNHSSSPRNSWFLERAKQDAKWQWKFWKDLPPEVQAAVAKVITK